MYLIKALTITINARLAFKRNFKDSFAIGILETAIGELYKGVNTFFIIYGCDFLLIIKKISH